MYVFVALFAMLAGIGAFLLGQQPSTTAHYDAAAQSVATTVVSTFIKDVGICGTPGACVAGSVSPAAASYAVTVTSDQSVDSYTDGLGNVITVWSHNDPNNLSSGAASSTTNPYNFVRAADVAQDFIAPIAASSLQNTSGQLSYGVLYNNTIIGSGNTGTTAIPTTVQPSVFDGTSNHQFSQNGEAVLLYQQPVTVAQSLPPSTIAPAPTAPTAVPPSSPSGSSSGSAAPSTPPTTSLVVQTYWYPEYSKNIATGESCTGGGRSDPGGQTCNVTGIYGYELNGDVTQYSSSTYSAPETISVKQCTGSGKSSSCTNVNEPNPNLPSTTPVKIATYVAP